MIDFSVSVTIKRPVEDVLAYVTDLANDPPWHTDTLEARKTSEGPIGVGTTYHIRFKPFMGAAEGNVEVMAFEPNRREVLRGEMGPMRPSITHVVQATDGATRLTRKIELEPTGVMWLMQPVLRIMMRKRNDGFLTNLKRRLQTSPSAMEPS